MVFANKDEADASRFANASDWVIKQRRERAAKPPLSSDEFFAQKHAAPAEGLAMAEDDATAPCVICTEPLTAQGRGALACEHSCFHLDCIREWSKVHNVCPLCKAPFNAIRVPGQRRAVRVRDAEPVCEYAVEEYGEEYYGQAADVAAEEEEHAALRDALLGAFFIGFGMSRYNEDDDEDYSSRSSASESDGEEERPESRSDASSSEASYSGSRRARRQEEEESSAISLWDDDEDDDEVVVEAPVLRSKRLRPGSRSNSVAEPAPPSASAPPRRTRSRSNDAAKPPPASSGPAPRGKKENTEPSRRITRARSARADVVIDLADDDGE